MRDAIGNHARFAAAGACQNEDRAFSRLGGFELLRDSRSFERSIGLRTDSGGHLSAAILFYSNALREISRLIDIAAAANGTVISEQLQRNDFEDRKQEFVG